MKTAKKLLCMLLAVAVVACLCVPALAAGDGKISVMEAGEYAYKGYRIFNAEKDANGDVSYSIDADSVWYDVVKDFPGLAFEQDGSVYKIQKLNNFSAADFAEHLKDNIPAEAVAVDFVDGVADNLGHGYYLVVSSDDNFASMQPRASLATVLDENVAIQNKNDQPFDKELKDHDGEWAKQDSAEIGDVIDFRIMGKVMDSSNQDSFVYWVKDTLDAGLTFDKESLVVKVNGVAVELEEIQDAGAQLTGDQVRFDKNGYTFEISLEMLERGQSLAGKDIEITYQATVNENALAVVSENNANVMYGNQEIGFTNKDSMTKTYTSQLIIDKFETGSPESKLAGAKFVLKNADGKFYKYADNKVQWVDAQADATVAETDSQGAAQFIGLEDGDYELVEIAAPAGYTMLSDAIAVHIDGSSSTAVGLSEDQINLALTSVSNISNTPGTLLPSTGGIGTKLFYLVGAALVLGAGAYLIFKKRPEENAEA